MEGWGADEKCSTRQEGACSRACSSAQSMGAGWGGQVCFLSPCIMLGSLGPCAAHRTHTTPRVGAGCQPRHPSLSTGSLLDFLKSDEGKMQPLPKLIDFSAQVRRVQTFPSSPLPLPLAPEKDERGDGRAQELTWDLGSALFEQAKTQGVEGMQERTW